MLKGFKLLRSFRKDKSGATAIEYGMIAALIAVAVIGSLRSLGGGNGGMWDTNSENIATAIENAKP